MNDKKQIILLLSLLTVCISFSIAFGDEIEEYEVRNWEIEKYYLDIDQDGEDETKIVIDREDKEISIGDDEISYEGFLYDILYEDLTDDGNLEIVVATKDEGSSSPLSYKVYRLEDDEPQSIFKREGIYRGVIEVDDGKIIEKMPLYSDDDPNGYPSEYLIREYIYDGDDFELDDEDTEDIEEMEIVDRGTEPSRKYNKYYENPDRSEIEDIIEEVSLDKGIPPVILKAIAYTESGLRQFEDGEPLVSFDGISYGVMQVTPGKVHTKYDEEKLKYDIEYNIEAGADVLLSKWNYAFESNPKIPKVGDGDPRILENWYFAIWAYNGWSQSNNPNMIPYDHISWVQRKAYQDKVIDYAEDEFDEEITKIDEDDLPETGLPDEDDDFDTPKPKHKGEYNTYDYGDIIISMVNSGLVLRDDDWDKIETIQPRVAMITLAGPEYHNGYVRYKVRTVDEDGDESIGWVAMNWTKSMRNSDVNDDDETDLDDVDEIMDNIGEDDDLEILDMNYDDEIDEYDAFLVEREYDMAKISDGYKVLDEQEDVSDSKDWIIRFNDKLDSDTVNNKNIYVEDKSNGEKVDAKVKLQSDGKSVKIYSPDEDYISGNTYIIKIEDDIESYKGKGLKKPVAMEFTIEF